MIHPPARTSYGFVCQYGVMSLLGVLCLLRLRLSVRCHVVAGSSVSGHRIRWAGMGVWGVRGLRMFASKGLKDHQLQEAVGDWTDLIRAHGESAFSWYSASSHLAKVCAQVSRL
eukprot:GHVO01034545.1.p1 GENE.GHVO01034545.1~~GHVO01034545.1.p1  ORF type:complete len:114 (-),score=2.22 GHVO01034545.1:687-1028(-)